MLTRRASTLIAILMLTAAPVNAQHPTPGPGSNPKQQVAAACKRDIARFCSKVPPGQGRVKACMKEHVQELSEPCKEALFQAWLRD